MLKKQNSLQTQTVYFLAITFIAAALIVAVLIKIIMLNGIEKLESQYVTEHVNRAENALQGELNQLAQLARDWAPWDDTYYFIQDHNEAYIRNNLVPETFSNLNLDMMVFISADGQYVFAKEMERSSGRLVAITQELEDKMKQSGLYTNKDPRGYKQGLLMLDKGPLLFAAYPILTSKYQGPVRGNVIVGRFLSAAEVSRIGSGLKLRMDTVRIDQAHSPIFDRITRTAPVKIEIRQNDKIQAYTVIPDIYRQPALGIVITMDRGFSAVGMSAVKYLGYAMTLIGLIFMLAVGIFLRKKILFRLNNLSQNVNRIGGDNDSPLHLPDEPQNDEIAVVSSAINIMLDKLQASKGDLQASEEKYRAFVEKGRDIVFTVDLHGIITYMSPNCEEIIGCTDEAIKGVPFKTILHPESQEGWNRIMAQVCSGC